MSKECKRKFGVRKISRFNLDLICKDCGQRAGLHHSIIGDERCPTKSEMDISVKDANEEEPDHDLEYHDKKCEGR